MSSYFFLCGVLSICLFNNKGAWGARTLLLEPPAPLEARGELCLQEGSLLDVLHRENPNAVHSPCLAGVVRSNEDAQRASTPIQGVQHTKGVYTVCLVLNKGCTILRSTTPKRTHTHHTKLARSHARERASGHIEPFGWETGEVDLIGVLYPLVSLLAIG